MVPRPTAALACLAAVALAACGAPTATTSPVGDVPTTIAATAPRPGAAFRALCEVATRHSATAGHPWSVALG